MEKSEFGKGFIYCLVLFAKHTERVYDNIKDYKELTTKSKHPYLWSEEQAIRAYFNGASDHLYELEVPENLPESIKKKVLELKEKALEYGHDYKRTIDGITEKELEYVLKLLEDICIDIDKWLGVQVLEAEYK